MPRASKKYYYGTGRRKKSIEVVSIIMLHKNLKYGNFNRRI